jgi:type II secretory pathway pseudopilin PulG
MRAYKRVSRRGVLTAGEDRRSRRGTILLEVVIALGLFFVTAAVVFGGLSSSLDTARRLIVRARAADMAVTKLSEIRLGLFEIADDGPNSYEDDDLADWTWEIVTEYLESDVLLEVQEVQVEVIIKHISSGQEYRLVRVLRPEEGGRYRHRDEDMDFAETGP